MGRTRGCGVGEFSKVLDGSCCDFGKVVQWRVVGWWCEEGPRWMME